MDAHFFRKLAKELLILKGARVEKIHSPAHDILSMRLFLPEPGFMGQRKWRLIMRFGRKDPLLFLSHAAMPNPLVPRSQVMRLRKYVQGVKLGAPVVNWVERALALPFSPPKDILDSEKNPPSWLMLDLKTGPALLGELPEGFANPPQWPDPAQLAALLDASGTANADAGAPPAYEQNSAQSRSQNQSANHPWRDYPVLTPALRKSLSRMDLPDALALLVDLENGEGDIFAYAAISDEPRQSSENKIAVTAISAWPLEEPGKSGLLAVPGICLDEFCPALSAAMHFGESLTLSDFGTRLVKEREKPLKAEQNRLKKLLKKLDHEEERLMKMRAERSKGLLIQANLHRYDKESKLAHIMLEVMHSNINSQHTDAEGKATGQKPSSSAAGRFCDTPDSISLTDGAAATKIKIDLDPKLSLLHNMEAFFKRSNRGERGLRFLAERRASVRRELEAGLEVLDDIPARGNEAIGKNSANNMANADSSFSGCLSDKGRQSERNRFYSVFRSSDGYAMLLGKSAKGNHELMRLALPHDYWLHSELGQSAHLIIRRKHAADEVPERTMKEAGILVGLKSWQSADAKADIICSLGKDIKPLKKAAQGTAKINKLLRSFTVELDLDLPRKLRAE